ncbi:MAG: hypothetical protein A2Z99_03495 [Treponema sp. GWB1_62_6]|nr:MAG: hypothetical protein A2Z99_03495 [Treponema sp. GWB1_62_6]
MSRKKPYLKKIAILLCASVAAATLPALEGDPSFAFQEIWGYLISGSESAIDASFPVSDIAYFAAGLNSFGTLVGVPDVRKVRPLGKRVHLVVAETGNQALTHFCLDPAYPVRDALVRDITLAAVDFDGVQIDFEAVNAKDKEHFLAFLSRLKGSLGNRTLSVALVARWRDVNDAYDYGRISAIADRVIIMAYDEHWSSSGPGAIASLEWCRTISDYAQRKIGAGKLVMALPFYGRAWADKNPAKAYAHAGISRIISEKELSAGRLSDESPFFEYQETVNVRVFFEDARSLGSRLRLYSDALVGKVAFWRLGLEDAEIWKALRLVE